jgi:hypothetical protein
VARTGSTPLVDYDRLILSTVPSMNMYDPFKMLREQDVSAYPTEFYLMRVDHLDGIGPARWAELHQLFQIIVKSAR